MDLEKARQIAVNEISKHPALVAKGWSFEFDRAKMRLGCTHFHNKTITISHYMTGAATEAEFMQTLYHEIAHALLPHWVGHDAEWKAQARKLGYTGGRTSPNPYQAALARARRPNATAKSNVAKAVSIGDILVLPNKVAVQVIAITEHFVKALSVTDKKLWTISAQDAIYLGQ